MFQHNKGIYKCSDMGASLWFKSCEDHSLLKTIMEDYGGPTGGFGDLGRMAIYFQRTREHLQLF